jgi:hypothetical protein
VSAHLRVPFPACASNCEQEMTSLQCSHRMPNSWFGSRIITTIPLRRSCPWAVRYVTCSPSCHMPRQGFKNDRQKDSAQKDSGQACAQSRSQQCLGGDNCTDHSYPSQYRTMTCFTSLQRHSYLHNCWSRAKGSPARCHTATATDKAMVLKAQVCHSCHTKL